MAARSARLALGGCAAVLALAACSAGSSAHPGTQTSASPSATGSVPATPAAGSPAPVIPGAVGAPRFIQGALSPAQLQAAYNTGPLLAEGITGRGQTIAIIVPFGSPTIKQDLAAYDKAWHLPAPPSFRIIAPVGAVPRFRLTSSRSAAAAETAMDVEAAHLMAPGAALLLVETPSFGDPGPGGLPDFVEAMAYVIRHHLGSVISMSVGGAEANFPSVRRVHQAILGAGRPGSLVTLVAATGDDGVGETKRDGALYPTPQVEWPASDPLVVAVGGTRLGKQPPSAPTAPATSWPGSGGGRSAVFARPPWQRTVSGVAGRWRAIPDISLDASDASGLELYITPRVLGPGAEKWQKFDGTSLATPLFAGVVALADQAAGRPLGPVSPLLYQLAAQHDPGIIDVQGPGNTFRYRGTTVRGFPAGPGYDLVTGLGTIDAAKLVPDLVRLASQEAH
jgi:subtilase family serine protease